MHLLLPKQSKYENIWWLQCLYTNSIHANFRRFTPNESSDCNAYFRNTLYLLVSAGESLLNQESARTPEEAAEAAHIDLPVELDKV